MPIYAYRCEDCGHELDALQKISDPPLTECPACGAQALKKQLTAAAFRLKGGGWYETDFKKDGKKNLHESGASEPKKSETKSADSSAAKDTKKTTPDRSSSASTTQTASKPAAA